MHENVVLVTMGWNACFLRS